MWDRPRRNLQRVDSQRHKSFRSSGISHVQKTCLFTECLSWPKCHFPIWTMTHHLFHSSSERRINEPFARWLGLTHIDVVASGSWQLRWAAPPEVVVIMTSSPSTSPSNPTTQHELRDPSNHRNWPDQGGNQKCEEGSSWEWDGCWFFAFGLTS